ncbi:hypothetical protein J6W78_07950 [bacterium]|nr:hypothetical protein [bacterium]
MKNLLRLFFVIFSIFFLVSCGGDESNSDDDGATVSLRMLRDSEDKCYPEMSFDCLSQEIAAIALKITDRNGLPVPINGKPVLSIERTKWREFKNKLTGIKNVEDATLTVSLFFGADVTHPKWEGKVTNLSFKKGETTKATVLLYPVKPQPTELDMPNKLQIARFGHTATVLGDNRVLVAGGFISCDDYGTCAATESVEIIDIESGIIESSTGENKTLVNLNEKRAMHTAIPLNDGSVIFIGGVQNFSSKKQEEAFDGYPPLPYSQTNPVTTIERYMPSYPKFNMKNNGEDKQESSTEIISVPEENKIPFMAFQSILVQQTVNDQENGIAVFDVFLVGGVDENGKPSNKTYKFSITDSTAAAEKSVSIGKVTELKETSSPMILPALAYNNGSIFAVGGRPVVSSTTTNEATEEPTNEATDETTDEATDETTDEATEETTVETSETGVVASIISENESKDIEANMSNNIFFANSIAANNALYTLGGMPCKSGEFIDSDQNGVIRKWNLTDGSFITPENGSAISSNGQNVAFAGTLYDSYHDNIILIGGTGAESTYQTINASTLTWNKDAAHNMKTDKDLDKRVMPKASIIPSGVIGERPILVITGGTSALNNTGSAANTIKINIL